jgi:hypothetical protein
MAFYLTIADNPPADLLTRKYTGIKVAIACQQRLFVL